MQIDVISCMPQMIEPFLSYSIVYRAIQKKLLKVNLHNLRDFSKNKHKKIDHYPYGGTPGMLLMIEPIVECIEFIKNEKKNSIAIYTAPDGETFSQKIANELSTKENIIILCGHYKGIDERIRQNFIDREISIGDYVLSGGEIPATVIIDSISRLLPGVLSDESSLLYDSFQDNLLGPPLYTRPVDFKGLKVPEILLSGNHEKIADWQLQKSIEKTKKLRPDILDW